VVRFQITVLNHESGRLVENNMNANFVALITRGILLCLLAGGFTASSAAQDMGLLTQNEQIAPERVVPAPAPGTLILPGEQLDKDSASKKCMTVCAQWGEECNYINRGSAGTTRSCRRTCQQYTEECF